MKKDERDPLRAWAAELQANRHEWIDAAKARRRVLSLKTVKAHLDAALSPREGKAPYKE
jgi:hypothetical protein